MRHRRRPRPWPLHPAIILKSVTLGGEGGFDYLNMDPDSGHLFITRGDHVMVVDVDAGKMLTDHHRPVGRAWHRLCERQGLYQRRRRHKVAVVDSKSLQKLSEIAVGTRPDGDSLRSLFQARLHLQRHSNDSTAIDVAGGGVAGTVALGGKPETASSDGAGTIFVISKTRMNWSPSMPGHCR